MTLKQFIDNKKGKLSMYQVIIYDEGLEINPDETDKIWDEPILIFKDKNGVFNYIGILPWKEGQRQKNFYMKYGERHINEHDIDKDNMQIFIYLNPDIRLERNGL